MQAEANVHGAIQAQARAQPTANQVGNHPKKLIEQKQCRDLQRAVAKRMEMQHHQHAQRAIGEGESPVVASDQQVLANFRRKAGEGMHGRA